MVHRQLRFWFGECPISRPTAAAGSRAEVFLRYLDYFRDRLAAKLRALPEGELRASRVPSGWTPLELLKHLTFVELRGPGSSCGLPGLWRPTQAPAACRTAWYGAPPALRTAAASAAGSPLRLLLAE